MRYRLLLATVLSLCTISFLTLSPACASTRASPDVRGALDAFAIAADPASHLAHEGCIARKEAIVSAIETHKLTPLEGRAQLDDAIEVCNVLAIGFDHIRALHDQAADAVESGQLQTAQERLSDLREAWRGLSLQPPPKPSTPGAMSDGGSS